MKLTELARMIIRATKKLLNTSRIEPIKNLNESKDPFPGEWYAGLVPTGRPGSMLIHFLHSSTKLSIICPGKSIKKELLVFPERLEELLRRLGYSKLIFQFQAHTTQEIYTTNSRSMLAYMNQMKYAIEYRLALAEVFEEIINSDIEDMLSDMLLSTTGPRKYEKPTDILQRLVNET